MARISAGQFKGTPLRIPPAIRATEAKVRQALFNILANVLPGARIVDGFAGSGALGCEALSRGAAFVAFIESDTEAVMAIRENLERLAPEVSREAWQVLHLDIEQGLRALAQAGRPFDIVLLDPPYRSDGASLALNALGQYAMLAPAGLVVVEHDRRTAVPASIGTLRQETRHRYGDTVLSFYRLAARPAGDTGSGA
jgi:16S rRNA (guanine(966)-N(2))-methyltransferase RsmD